MTINQNSYLQGIEAVLTPKSDEKYIQIDPDTSKCWRSSDKPDDTKVSEIFSTLNHGIEKRMATKELLSIGELETRIIYLKSISNKVQELSAKFFSDMDSWDRLARAKLSSDYRKEREQLQQEVAEQYSLLDETINRYQRATEKQLESTLVKKEKVLKMKGDDLQDLDTQEILEIAVIAFEHSYQEESSLWVNQHDDLLTALYSWIKAALDQGKISYEDVLYIARAIERGGKYFADFRVPFKCDEETVIFNRFQIIAHNELMGSFLEEYDEESKAYEVTESQLRHLQLIKEDMISGIIEGYEQKSLDEILEILNLKYFQYDRSFSVSTFKILNERDLGVRLSCGEEEIVVKLDRMTPEAAKVLQHPFIKKETFELNLASFDKMSVSDDDEAERIFKLLVKHLPNVEFLWLPVPCALGQKGIQLLKKLKGLQVIHLNFNHCKSYKEFADFYLPLQTELQQEKWRICIENTSHFNKNEAIKVLAHFPQSKSVSLENKEELTDEDVMKICVNLPMLESLNLNGCIGIGDEALGHIGEYGKLIQGLRLRGCCSVTDQGVINLLKILGDRLTQIDFGGTNMTTAAALGIADHCKNITCLGFEACDHINDASVKAIAAECKGIQYYDLKGTSITDEGVKAIAGTGSDMRSISFNGCYKVTEEAIRELLGYCKSLERLDTRGTAVSLSQLQKLQSDFPNVTIL